MNIFHNNKMGQTTKRRIHIFITLLSTFVMLIYGIFVWNTVIPTKLVLNMPPLPNMEKTSDYGTYFIFIPHYGIDITGLDENSRVPVVAPTDGIVRNVVNNCEEGSIGDFCGNGFGNTIEIEAENVIIIFGHLKKDSFFVQKGSYVTTGDALAMVGSSGNSTGPHLHYEIRHKPGIIIWQTVNPDQVRYTKPYTVKDGE